MKKKYTLSLIIIFCMILCCITVYFDYQNFNKKRVDINTITLVSEDLSINFLNGNEVHTEEEQEQIQFSITNHGEKALYYYIKLKNVQNSLETYYEITSSAETFEPLKASFGRTTIVEQFEIPAKETHRYTMTIENKKGENLDFQLDIDKESFDESFRTVLLKNNQVKEDSLENGLLRKQEQNGEIYYFHGNVTNNYVSFGGFLWRVLKINEDGTVKLILNQTTENMVEMKETNEEMFEIESSKVMEHLTNWYATNLSGFDDKIVSTNYCYDDSILTDENNEIKYLANYRILDENAPTNACNGTMISRKVALLTADEASLAGTKKEENKEYFLYNEGFQGSWWTMTPYNKKENTMSFMAVDSNGAFQIEAKENQSLFVRPVITLGKRVKVTGDGTLENPFVIENNV